MGRYFPHSHSAHIVCELDKLLGTLNDLLRQFSMSDQQLGVHHNDASEFAGEVNHRIGPSRCPSRLGI